MKAAAQRSEGDRSGLTRAEAKTTGPEMYALGDVRRSRDVTQVELAERLEVAQATVSKFEKSNPGVSTLRRYVEALGGHLELMAVFDDDEMLLDCGRGQVARASRSAGSHDSR